MIVIKDIYGNVVFSGSEKELRFATFRDVDLSGVDLSGMKLTFAKFINVNLTNTILKGSDIRKIYLSKTNIKSIISDRSTLMPEEDEYCHACV